MGKRINTAKWSEKYQRWQINVQKDGVRRSFYSSVKGRNGQREANRKADNWLDNNLINQNTTVEVLYKEFLTDKKLNVGTSRIKAIESTFNNHILPLIGKKKVSILTEQNLQTILNKMFTRKCSYGYIKACKDLLKEFIKFARKNNITTLYPENLTVNKNAPVYDRDTLQPKDIYKLFNSDKTLLYSKEEQDFYIYCYRFIVATGIRRGEAVGLKWTDIVKDIHGNDVMYIKRSINRHKEITKGKTNNADRVSILPKIASDILGKQKELLKSQNINTEFIFPNENTGDFIHPVQLSNRFIKYAKYNNLSRSRLHELRHTFISINQNNLSMGILKDIVGHGSNINTLGIYGHTINGDLEKASNKINDRFIEVLKEGKQ